MTLFDEVEKEGIKIREYLRHLSIGAVVLAALIAIIIIVILWYSFGYNWILIEPTEPAFEAITSTV